jgi:hypothetical protein
MFKINKNNKKYIKFKNYIESDNYEERQYKDDYIKKRKMIFVNIDSRFKFNIDATKCDIIDCFYLVIKKDDLTHDFLKSEVRLDIGGSNFHYRGSIKFFLIKCIINGYLIKYNGEKIQIPILNFNIFKTKCEGKIIKGFPLITTKYHTLEILVENCKKSSKGLFSTFNVTDKYRKKLSKKIVEDLVITNHTITYFTRISNTIIKNENIRPKYHWIKAFVVVFHPKSYLYENNSIKSFNLVIDNKKYKLDIKELIDKNVYLIPLSSEFNSLKNLKKTYENYNNITDEGFDYDEIGGKFDIEIETTQNIDFFDIEVIPLSVNLYRMAGGLCCIHYSNV